MANIIINNVKIVGISSSIPNIIEKNIELNQFSIEEIQKLIKLTGIEERRISNEQTCTSDLCYEAAESLINELGWKKEDIDALVFVTQTPDYILPTTSSILQDKLRLSSSCMTLDISSGCSGYINGIITIGQLISGGNIKKGLLLVGDTISKICNPKDKSTYPLFGDAGSATAIVYDPTANPIFCNIFSDGSGYKAIKIEDGGYRNKFNDSSLEIQKIDENIERSKVDLELEGMDVFTFGIDKAPSCINSLINDFNIDKAKIDYYVFHQANKFMNETIRKKLGLKIDNVPYSLKEFGNTSSASIPLTICTQLINVLKGQEKKVILCGFGVGLSWGSVLVDLENIIIPELVIYE
jgi:3-oxoacyl-[acyl-carrier-protein] synthase-3